MPGVPLDFPDPRFRRFHDYWRGKHAEDRLPGRRDIDPLEIPDLLPHISMLDVLRSGPVLRFRFRLVGTANVRLFGREHTGAHIEEVFEAADAERLRAIYREIVERREPHFGTASTTVQGRPPVRYDRLMLPLAGDGATVDMLMGLVLAAEPPLAAP